MLALGGGLVKERMGFTKMLRDNGIKVSYGLDVSLVFARRRVADKIG